MKSLYIFITLLISGIYINNAKKQSEQNYIQFQFTGPQQCGPKELFIVKKSVDFETMEKVLDEMITTSSRPLTKEDKEYMWKEMFNTVITDKRTFSKFIEFIDANPTFYTFKEQSQYAIIINGARHYIRMELQKEFFARLSKYLENEKCDKIIIKEVNIIRDAR